MDSQGDGVDGEGDVDAEDSIDPGDVRQGGVSRRQYAAVVGLCVVGLVFAVAFGFVMSGIQGMGDPEVEEFDPAADPAVATADTEIYDLDGGLADASDEVRAAIEEAAETGSYAADGDVPEGIYEMAESPLAGGAAYAVYGDEYYRWTVDADRDRDRAEITLSPVDADAVMADVAVPYENATEDTQAMIDGGDADYPQGGVFVRDGTYYAVSGTTMEYLLEDPSRFVRTLALAAITSLLTPVGVAFLSVGGWFLYRIRQGAPTAVRTDEGAKIALVAALLAGLGAAVGGSSVLFVVMGAALAAATVGLAVVGYCLRTGQSRRTIAIVLGTPIAVLAVSVLAGGILGIFLGVVSLLVAGIAGSPLIGYGYWFADESDAPDRGSTDRGGPDGSQPASEW